MFIPKSGSFRVIVIASVIAFATVNYTIQWFLGFPIGPRKTDASFFHAGTELRKDATQATKWSYLPCWQRGVIRTIGTAIVAMFVWLYVRDGITGDIDPVTGAVIPPDRTWFWVAVWSVILIVGGTLIRYGVKRGREWRHRTTYVEPLNRALAPALGMEPVRAGSWITIPRHTVARVPLVELPDVRPLTWARGTAAAQWIGRMWARRPELSALPLVSRFHRDDSDDPITVHLPDAFTGSGDARKTVERIVRDKTGIGDLVASFSMVGKPIATFVRAIRPPERAMWADYVSSHVSAAPESAPVIGIGAKDAAVSVDLDADSPHVMISAGSGGGKSVTSRAIVAQGLHNGGIALILDVKRVSHAWARGLPNVHYARDISDIHNGLLWAKSEVDRRYTLIDQGADIEGNVSHIDLGPRVFILAEEMNATINRLTEYWQEVRTKDDPKSSPAVKALGDILFMGRASRIHVIAIAQLMTARTLGGPEARENFSTRILARYSANAWRMLVPEIWPMPRASRHAGRVQVALAGAARETQVIYTEPGEAREWAGSGTVATFPTTVREYFSVSDSGHGAADATDVAGRSDQGEPLRHDAVEPPARPNVSIGDAADGRIVSLSASALRSARDRDPEFPKSVEKRGRALLYSADELIAWERNRITPARQWTRDVTESEEVS